MVGRLIGRGGSDTQPTRAGASPSAGPRPDRTSAGVMRSVEDSPKRMGLDRAREGVGLIRLGT
jgi:hypothetical protein